MFGVGSIFSMSTPVSFFKAADQIARQQGHVVFLTRCCEVKITAFNLLGFFPRTGFSRFGIVPVGPWRHATNLLDSAIGLCVPMGFRV